MRQSELERKYLKNRTIENKVKFKKQNKFCSKLKKRNGKNSSHLCYSCGLARFISIH